MLLRSEYIIGNQKLSHITSTITSDPTKKKVSRSMIQIERIKDEQHTRCSMSEYSKVVVKVKLTNSSIAFTI